MLQQRRTTADALDRIERFNAGREPERLALKYRDMCKSPFAFFRGTAHLFWEDLAARGSALPKSPLVWACGDLHFENFGSFQGDNGLSYFDLNDFDESALAPATWEVSRFVAGAYGRGGYVLHELQPSNDRLSLKDARGNQHHLRSAAKAMGRVIAWAQLRSSGRQDSATADDLIAFAGA
ncbi:MAG TPA: DUF2252 family protein, partial [Gemmatimonadaceae bacterium]